MILRLLLTALAFGTVATACGSRIDGETAARERAGLEREALSTANVSAAGGLSGGEKAANDSGTGGTGGRPANPASADPRPDAAAATKPTAAPSDPTGIVSSVEPKCPTHAQAVKITAQTVPFADISYAASFADGKSHNIFGLAQAGLDGKWVLTFVVPPDAALGDARVLVVAAHPDGGGGEGSGPFRVTETGAC